jgi:hypothetical protein
MVSWTIFIKVAASPGDTEVWSFLIIKLNQISGSFGSAVWTDTTTARTRTVIFVFETFFYWNRFFRRLIGRILPGGIQV